MSSLLLIIDLQKDFINDNTKHILSRIENTISEKRYDNIAFTRYINSTHNICYKKLDFKGCLSEEGQKIAIDSNSYKVIDKEAYTGYVEELKNYLIEKDIKEIYLCGLNTDCCVLKTALDLFEAGYEVYVLKDLCASTEGNQLHLNALEIIKNNIGKQYIL